MLVEGIAKRNPSHRNQHLWIGIPGDLQHTYTNGRLRENVSIVKFFALRVQYYLTNEKNQTMLDHPYKHQSDVKVSNA